MAIIEGLQAKRDFTAAESDLADYILEHVDEVSRMGIADLAAASYKSNATIIRLCRKLGVDGWRDFRVALASNLEKVRNRIEGPDPNRPFKEKSSSASIMSNIVKLEQAALTDCYAGVNPELIGDLARAAVKARKIIYYALGDSYATLYAFGALMSKIGIECVAGDQYRFQLEAAYHASPDDLALIVSYSGRYLTPKYTSAQFRPGLAKQIEQLRARRCKIAVITANAQALDVHPRYDCSLLLPQRESMFGKVATFYSQTCIRYVLNCVYSVAFSQNYGEYLREKDQIEMVDPGIYLPT